MAHLNFQILAFSTKFCTIKINLSGNTVWPQPKWTIIGIFYDFVSTQNVNAACFEWDFFFDFQTPCPFDPKIVRVCRKKCTLKRHLPMFSPCVRIVMTFSKCNDYHKIKILSPDTPDTTSCERTIKKCTCYCKILNVASDQLFLSV